MNDEWHLRNSEIHLKNAHYKLHTLRASLSPLEEATRKQIYAESTNFYKYVWSRLSTNKNYDKSFVDDLQNTEAPELDIQTRMILDHLIDHCLAVGDREI
jgi:hypothetical protein